MAKEDVSNKTVLILAILVVIIVASSMWLVLNKLSDLEMKDSTSRTVTVTRIIEQAPPAGGEVGLSIVPEDKEGENDG